MASPTTSRPRAASARRTPARQAPSPTAVLIAGISRAFTAVWLGIAHVLGAIIRGVGRGARDLDPAHRRDGLGLAYLGGAIIVGSVLWFHAQGFLTAVVTAVVTGGVGVFDTAAPIALGAMAFQVLRHPDAPKQHNGRLLVGWSIFTLSLIGIAHILLGNPAPSDGAAAMQAAGGWLDRKSTRLNSSHT